MESPSLPQPPVEPPPIVVTAGDIAAIPGESEAAVAVIVKTVGAGSLNPLEVERTLALLRGVIKGDVEGMLASLATMSYGAAADSYARARSTRDPLARSAHLGDAAKLTIATATALDTLRGYHPPNRLLMGKAEASHEAHKEYQRNLMRQRRAKAKCAGTPSPMLRVVADRAAGP